MRAEEARLIAEEKAIKLEDVLEVIKKTAEYGGVQSHFTNLHNDVRNDLIRLGYSIRLGSDPMGLETFIVGW